MHDLSIDIETYSSVDIGASGHYKYAASPDFDILLFAYAIDGGKVEIVDLARGEKLPVEVLAAITDDSVLKHAWNASFERICLARYLGRGLSAASWRCTMVHAAALGLPLSLKEAGAAFKPHDQKMSEGTSLIKLFSCPQKRWKPHYIQGRTREVGDLQGILRARCRGGAKHSGTPCSRATA